MKNFLVIGNPIEHSVSPQMHNANFKSLGLLDCKYDKLLVKDISQIRQIAIERNLFGFNVTLPFKQKIVEFLDEVFLPDEIDAVNTVKVEFGKMIGYNTDTYGILQDFKEKNIDLVGKNILVLGYGGLGKTLSTVFRKKENQCNKVIVANRSAKDGVDIVANIDTMLEMMRDYDIVVNTTSIGSFNEVRASLGDILKTTRCLYDCTPANSRLVQMINKSNAGKAYNGLGMLVHQGAKSFEIWTGMKADVEAMRNSLNI